MSVVESHELPFSPRRIDACGLVPTRTVQTERHYRATAQKLMRQSQPPLNADDLARLSHTIAWVCGSHAMWSTSTIRQYRAALRLAIDDLESAIEITPKESNMLRQRIEIGPTPRGSGARRQTSARKRRSLPMAEWERIIESLAKSRTATGLLLGQLVKFNAFLGLRPMELRDAYVVGRDLLARCAKATNGRAIAQVRELELPGYTDDDIADMAQFLEDFRRAADSAGCWQRFHERLAKHLERVCRRLGIAKVSLYTLRHCAIATAKNSHSAREVAAHAGQKSEETAKRAYAKKSAGWVLPSPMVVPSVEIVARVKASPKSRFQPGQQLNRLSI